MENNGFINAGFGGLLQILDARTMIHVFEIDDAGKEKKISNGATPVYKILAEMDARGGVESLGIADVDNYLVVGITANLATSILIKKRF